MVDARTFQKTLRLDRLADEIRDRDRPMDYQDISDFLGVERHTASRYMAELDDRDGFRRLPAPHRNSKRLVITND